jgi:glycosyltransferase involved in cell wall biosynthesis
VDLSRFTPDGPALPRSGRPRLVSVGRLIPRKGITTLLEALAAVPGAELLLAGGPPLASLGSDDEARRLMFLADELGVADRVRFLGSIPHADVPALLRSADVYVTPPWYEPFGMAALEAIACGVPVIATAVGGLTETVIDGVTGLLVPPAESGPLAAAISALLSMPERRARIARAAVSHARRYSWERVTREILAVYERLV